jgi:hypothetical protein
MGRLPDDPAPYPAADLSPVAAPVRGAGLEGTVEDRAALENLDLERQPLRGADGQMVQRSDLSTAERAAIHGPAKAIGAAAFQLIQAARRSGLEPPSDRRRGTRSRLAGEPQ